MIGTSCFLDDFFSKKRPKLETSDRFSEKTLDFWSKKEQNVRFQINFKGKPNITERQFSQSVTVFYDRYRVLF